MLEWTGERYLPYGDPSIVGTAIHYEHLHRYAFASQYVNNKKVLDLASGEGFGTSILSKNAKCVVGIDIDHDAVLHASKTYKQENITFIEGSILNIPIKGRKIFDVIVCFEAIEHITEHDILFMEITRLLKNNGVLIISTPNKKTYSDDVGYKNPYHRKELYYSEFYELLKKNFVFIYLSGQRVISGSSIYPVSSQEIITSFSEFNIEMEGNRFSFSSDEEKIPRYFIAIASNIKLNPKQIQKSYLIDKSNAEIVLLNTQIGQCNTSIQSLQQVLSEKDSQLLETNKKILSLEQLSTTKDMQIQEITIKISEFSKHTHNLEAIVADRDNQITEFSKHAHNLEAIVTDRDNQIADLRQHARNLETIVTEQNQQLQEFIRFNQSLSNENQSIKQSLTYNLTTKFHKKIVERLLPQNSRRRKYYDLGLSGSRLLINEGWDRFWWCYNDRNHPKALITDHIIPLPQPEIKPQELDNIAVIQTNVSVIIPTKNAGPDFEFVLEKIKNQKGIKNIEIIIVDSGSTDTTIEIAKKYNCKIFSIRSEDFNHGLTRNYGAQQASGEFIVFLVQDAIPVGEYWLYNMVKTLLEESKIAAVTCRQVPRSDADLFAGFILWSHYKSLKRTQNAIYSCASHFNELSPVEKRIFAGIEDTCCMMRKQIFDKFKFRDIKYAEDIDIGIRFLESGYKTAFEFSTGVIHSHNRNSAYFFKRSFIDVIVLDSLLDIVPKSFGTDSSLKNLVEQVLGLYVQIKQSGMESGKISARGIQALNLLKNSLQSTDTIPGRSPYFSRNAVLGEIDSKNILEPILSECARQVNAHSFIAEDALIKSYCTILNDFAEYCSVYPSLDGREMELYESFDKLFALIAGSTLATYYCKKSHDQLSASESALMKTLGEGI
jgi:glycosyltransferase involved in cell wall biosynthesis/SAM-dependent methyltransferase